MSLHVVECDPSGGMEAWWHIMSGAGEKVLWPHVEKMKRRWQHIMATMTEQRPDGEELGLSRVHLHIALESALGVSLS